MSRIVLAVLAGILLTVAVPGCESSDPEDAEMTQRREQPAPRPAPGTEMGGGMSSEGEGGDEGEEPPPPPGG